jgi:hypothetical protein
MHMRNLARAETLANFTPVLCFSAFDEDARTRPVVVRSAEPAGDSLGALRSLVERMWLHPAEADMHRGTYEAMMTRALADCRSAAVKEGLLNAVRGVNGRDYVKALSSLRALAA